MKNAQYNFEHTKQRVMERYGMVLMLNQYQTWIDQIKTGKARQMPTRDDDRELWLVKLGFIDIPAVYNPATQRIETVLPKLKG